MPIQMAAGVQQLAGDATLLYYTMAEAQEAEMHLKKNGRNSHKPMTWLNKQDKTSRSSCFLFSG